ncbi:VanZ family protein [Allomuricauda sp. d1]|uniref:VanZ family protein n=1 Tax=Allomuricauda sp. d1 TaxID=3136725 RepID=UPI0031D5BFBE
MLKKNVYTILFVGWALFITTLSLFSFSSIETGGVDIPHIDKITHFFFYFFFVILAYLSLGEKYKNRSSSTGIIVRIVLFAIFYGLLIEGLQWLMPYGRAAEIWDASANALGAILGGLLTKTYISRTYKPK